ncbi:estradiol 17-beta-dehydrogenase 2 [Caerostris extrusa]|uniref:Estradiol 17-beta-dehydrogenase 2 n=1 Tax=Caerostris extrusa TaxID=172846 RepID=A0AAV4PI77_CAEEX|nr:estradiol 17-beta-dehydrogenase 2 [Caerostris extrusa]
MSEKIKPDNKAVLITGCDTGFGNGIARKLDAEGFHVFATCLNPSGPGATQLNKETSERLKILEMDVTSDERVQKAVEFVKENLGKCKLWAVVNNAGVFKGISVELSNIQDFKDCLEVNVIGHVRVTKAFLPLLRKSQGRVVNVTSLGGRVGVPHMTPYIVSKFAAVGFNECLRREMDIWGIRVIGVEPEQFRTPMADPQLAVKRVDEVLPSLNPSIMEDYGPKYFNQFKNFILISCTTVSPNTYRVIDALYSAVTSKYPNPIYIPSRNYIVEMLIIIGHCLPTCCIDFLSRATLFVTNCPIPKMAEKFLQVCS